MSDSSTTTSQHSLTKKLKQQPSCCHCNLLQTLPILSVPIISIKIYHIAASSRNIERERERERDKKREKEKKILKN